MEDSEVIAPFPYDQANFLGDLVLSWGIKLGAHYHNNPPSLKNQIKIPESLEINSSYHKLKNSWNIELTKSKPSFFKALWEVYKWKFIFANLPAMIFYNCNIIPALMIYYIIQYINDSSYSSYLVGIIAIYSGSVIVYNLTMNYSLVKIHIFIAGLKLVITKVIYNKALKTSFGSFSEGDQSGKLVSLISADLELLDGLNYLMFVLCLPSLLLFSAIVLWINLGIAGVIGLIIMIFNLPIIFF